MLKFVLSSHFLSPQLIDQEKRKMLSQCDVCCEDLFDNKDAKENNRIMIKKQIIMNHDNGIHGLSPFVDHLMSFDFSNVNFDFMNCSAYSSSPYKSLIIHKGERVLKSVKLDTRKYGLVYFEYHSNNLLYCIFY